MIYVNFNYRLGPLGFPQGQEGLFTVSMVLHLLTIDLADDRGALNLALKDQIAALEWIQANIGEFGGDKKKVGLSTSATQNHSNLKRGIRLPYLVKVLELS